MLRHRLTRALWAVLLSVLVSASASAQTPQPFPRGGSPPPAPIQPQAPAPAPAPPPAPAPAPLPRPVTAPADPATPSETTLGFPVYPGAQFIASYDAGRGQRYYLFGTTAAFAELVTFYRTQLKDRGNLVFQDPPTQMFEIGKFNNDTMAFPPGVTIKDWTSGGSKGYPNPKIGVEPARFASIIQIVPVPPPPAAAR